MFEAENNQLTLNADVSYMENYKALDEMKDYENLSALEQESQMKGGMGGGKFSLNPIGGKKGKNPAMMGTIGNAMIAQVMEK